MKRRDFFSLMAGAGLCATGLTRGALAGLGGGSNPTAGPYDGPLFVGFAADGGWDPTGFCDPHANLHKSYGTGDIVTLGGIKYANIGQNAAFFNRFADKLLVINGLDTSTNNHAIGRRHVWTGKQDETHPHWAAMAAGSQGPQQPLAFIGEASQSATEGVVARSRVSNSDVLEDLSFPNQVNPANPENLTLYHPEAADEMIEDWRSGRLQRMSEDNHLPKYQHALSNVITTRLGSNELELLQSYLPATLDDNQTRRQIQVTIAAYKAGITVAATFSVGSFDTHQNNDANQMSMRNQLFGHISFMWDEAERQGVDANVVCAVGSDFGRTPTYNNGNGKDHWQITSMLLMGHGIEGNRTVGATDSNQMAMKVDPDTLQLSDSGVVLRPYHVHAALRQLAGVSSELDARYPLGAPLPGGLLGVV